MYRKDTFKRQGVHFDPWYIKACLRFENLDDDISIDEKYVYERNMLYMFTRHSGNFQGIFHLTPQQYIHINELMLMIGAETYARVTITGPAA